MTAELHYLPGAGRHVLVDQASLARLRGHPPPKPAYELTGTRGRLDAIPVYVDICPCHTEEDQ